MKVSAPQFMSSSAPPADAPAPTLETPADPSVPPPPPEPPKQATWPQWFLGVDNALIVMALLFVFLMGSYAARNSDIFRHLATGQRLMKGTYSLGSDPFSYTGADRPWVNQSWLFDLMMYAVYSADNTGAVAVVLKAVVFAASFGVLLWFRRPGQAGWPWAVMILAGALAASGTANLRPVVFGTLFCSLLLLTVFQGDWSAARRNRTLLTVGGLCWLWGGFDSFAILAPVLLLAAAVGGAVQRAMTPTPAAPPPAPEGAPPVPEEQPELFTAPPPPKVLFLASAVALLGVILNPTFMIGVTKDPASAVAQLVPVELSFGSASVLAEDPEFQTLRYSLLTNSYWKSGGLGKNASSAGLAVLVLFGAGVLAVGVGRLPGGWLALWFVTLLLCFVNFRMVPLFAVAAVPLVCGLLNDVSARFRLGTTADGKTNAVLTASRLGRIVTVPAFLALLACTVPGWLQLQFSDPAFARRVEWRIAADEAAARGLLQIQQWREEDDLPSDARGFYLSPELGDYAAWFAPTERVSANTRFGFHAAELQDMVEARRAVLYPPRDEKTPPPPVAPVLDQNKAEYLVIGRPSVQISTPAVLTALFGLSGEPGGANARLRLDALWHLDGRTAVVGRVTHGTSRHARLSLDPARLAFAPQPGLPDGPLEMPLKQDAGWLSKLLLPPPVPAAFRDDGLTLFGLAEQTTRMEEQKWQAWQVGLQGAAGWWPSLRVYSDAELALPLLVHRAARQAVSQTPDDPLGYALLAEAHKSRFVPEYEPRESARQRLTGYARSVARLVPPEQATAQQRDGAAQFQRELFAAQLELGQYDLARDTVKEFRKIHSAAEAAEGGQPVPPLGVLWQSLGMSLDRFAPVYQQVMGQELAFGKDEFDFEGQAKKSGRNEPPSTAVLMKKLDDSVSAVVGRLNEEWDRGTRPLKPGQRAIVAWRRFGLLKAARDGIEAVQGQSPDAADVPPLDLTFALVTLELETGRVEQADFYLKKLDQELPANALDARAVLTRLRLWKLRLQGNFKEARALLDESQGGRFPRLTDREKQLAVNPGGMLALVGIAAPPFGAAELLPVFRPPANKGQEEVARLAAEFQKAHLNTHPILASGTPFRERLIAEAEYYYQRGILALLDGDVAAAGDCFRQALAPQGLRLDAVIALVQEMRGRGGEFFDLRQALFPSLYLLPHYLRLIDKYKDATPLTGGRS